jgi:hypothetical protein
MCDWRHEMATIVPTTSTMADSAIPFFILSPLSLANPFIISAIHRPLVCTIAIRRQLVHSTLAELEYTMISDVMPDAAIPFFYSTYPALADTFIFN